MKFHSIKPLRLALRAPAHHVSLGGFAQADQEAQANTSADAGSADTAPNASPPSPPVVVQGPGS